MDEPLVLVIEDDVQIRKFLRASLGSQGYRVAESETGKDGILRAKSSPPDLMIIDLGLPDMDGLAVIKEVRKWLRSPILVLSARGQELDKVTALDVGADDYLTKPFSVGELLARMRSALRRSSANSSETAEPTLDFGRLRVDLASRRVFVQELEVHLTPTQYRLLTVLARHAGKVLTHRQLLKEVWGPGNAEASHYLRVYMGQLRHKLEEEPARPKHILTEPGVGYRFAEKE